MDTGGKNQDSSGELAEKFLPRFEADQVIEEAGGEDQSGGREESPNKTEVTAQDVAALEGEEEEEGEGAQVGNHYGDAADPWDGTSMGLAVVVRVIEHPPADCDVPAERGQEERGGESHSGDYEKRVHSTYLRADSTSEGPSEEWPRMNTDKRRAESQETTATGTALLASYQATVSCRPISNGVPAVKPNSVWARVTSRQRRGWPFGLVTSQWKSPLKPVRPAILAARSSTA